MNKQRKHPGIKGNLDIFGDIEDGISHVYIHGDQEGLTSFAQLLLSIANVNQKDFPKELGSAREHVHLDPDYDLSKSSHRTIVGRLDEARSGCFPPRFIHRMKIKYRDAT